MLAYSRSKGRMVEIGEGDLKSLNNTLQVYNSKTGKLETGNTSQLKQLKKAEYTGTKKKIANSILDESEQYEGAMNEDVLNTITWQYENDKSVRKKAEKNENYLKNLYARQVTNKELEQLRKQLESPVLSKSKKQKIQEQITALQQDIRTLDAALLKNSIDASPGVKTAATIGQTLNKAAGTTIGTIEGLFRPVTTIASDIVGAINDDAGDKMRDIFSSENTFSAWYNKNAQEMDKYSFDTELFGGRVDLTNIPGEVLNMMLLANIPAAGYGGMAGNEFSNTREAYGDDVSAEAYIRALTNSAVKTASAYGTEKIGGIIPGKGIKNAFANGIWNTVGTEIIEENIDNTVNALYDFFTQNPTSEYKGLTGEEAIKQWWKDTQSTTLNTAILTSLTGGASKVSDKISGKDTTSNKKALNKITTPKVEVKTPSTDTDALLARAEENLTPQEKAKYEQSKRNRLSEDVRKAEILNDGKTNEKETVEEIKERKKLEKITNEELSKKIIEDEMDAQKKHRENLTEDYTNKLYPDKKHTSNKIETDEKIVELKKGKIKPKTETEAKVNAVKQQLKKDIENLEKFEKDKERTAKIKKGYNLEAAAEIRRIRQGNLLIPVEGGLTANELEAKIARERSNYIGKEVIVDGKDAKIVRNVYGNLKVQFEDGSTRIVNKEEVTPKIDVDKLIAEQKSGKKTSDNKVETKKEETKKTETKKEEAKKTETKKEEKNVKPEDLVETEEVDGKKYKVYKNRRKQFTAEQGKYFQGKTNPAVNTYITMGEKERRNSIFRKLVNNMQKALTRAEENIVVYRGAEKGENFIDKMVRSTTLDYEVAKSGYAVREKNGTVYTIYIEKGTPFTSTVNAKDPRDESAGRYWDASRELIIYPELCNIRQEGDKVYISAKSDSEINAILKENDKNTELSTADARELRGLDRKDGIVITDEIIAKENADPNSSKNPVIQKEKLPTKKEPTTEALAKIEEKNKKEFEKGLLKAGASINQTVATPEALANRKKMFESTLSSLEKSANRLPINKRAEFIENKLHAYDNYIADGGEVIQGYEELRAKTNTKKEIDNAKTIQKEVKEVEKSNPETKYIAVNPKTVDEIRNSQFELREKIDTINDEIDMVLEDTLVLEPEGSTLEEEYDKKKVPTKETNKAFYKWIKKTFVNEYNHLVEVDKANGNTVLEDAFLQASVAGTEGQYQVTTAQTDMDGNIIGKSIQEIANPIISNGAEAEAIFNLYANLQYDIARKQAKENYDIDYVDNRFSQYTVQQEQMIVDQLKEENPELIKLCEQVFEDIRTFYRNSNKIKVQQGMLPETMEVSDKFAKEQLGLNGSEMKELRNKEGRIEIDTVEYLSKMNPYYFKTERNVEWSDNPLSYNEPRLGIKGNKGLKENAERYSILPVFDSMAHAAVNEKIALRTNELYKKIAKDSGKGVRMQEVTKTDGSKTFVEMDNGKYSMGYYSDGKIKRAVISSDMYHTLDTANKAVDVFSKSTFGTYTKKINNFRRKVMTTINPGFLVRNHVMDLQDAYLNSNYGEIQYTKNLAKAYKEVFTNAEGFQKFKAMGGASGVQGFSNEKGLVRKTNVIEKADNFFEAVGSATEAIPRYAEYLCALENGKSQAEAFRESREVTVNFRKTGSLWKNLDKSGTTIFMGSASAGLNRAYQTIVGNQIDALSVVANKLKTKNPLTVRDKKILKRSAKSLTKIALSGILPAVINNMAYSDDEDKEFLATIPQYIRNNNYIIKVGDNGKYIALPRGRLTAITQLIGGLFVDETIPETDKLGITELLGFMWDNVGMSKPEDAFVGAPILDVIKNENYYGSDIYKDADSDKIKNEKVIKYLFKNYSGIIYDIYNFAVTGNSNAIPVVSKFYKDTNTTTNYASRYYAIKDKYENSKDPLEKLKFTSVKYDYNKYIAPLNKELNALKEQGASDKKIKEKEKEILETYKSMYDTVDKEMRVSNNKHIVYYRGYTYKLTTDSEGRTYYKKVS